MILPSKFCAISFLAVSLGICLVTLTSNPVIAVVPQGSGLNGNSSLVSARRTAEAAPESPASSNSNYFQNDDISDAGIFPTGPRLSTGTAVPQAMDYYYPSRSERLYDEIGSNLPPEQLGLQSRPTYPYRATKYWDAHDANSEEWGDLLELPYVRLGWFFNSEFTVFKPRISSSFSSGTSLDSTFSGNPVALADAGMNYSVMPKLEAGYRFEHGLGEIRAGYRYLSGSGSESIAGFDSSGTGTLATQLQVHILDVDLSILEFNAEGMPVIMPLLLVPGRLGLGKPVAKSIIETPLEYRMYFGTRVATLYYDTVANGDLQRDSVVNNFTGAGIHFGWEGNQRLPTRLPLFLHMRGEGSGMWGNLAQTFQRTAGPLNASSGVKYDAIGVPTLDFEFGFAYVPKWPERNFRLELAYRYEQWFSWAHTDDSQAEFFYSGVVARCEYKF